MYRRPWRTTREKGWVKRETATMRATTARAVDKLGPRAALGEAVTDGVGDVVDEGAEGRGGDWRLGLGLVGSDGGDGAGDREDGQRWPEPGQLPPESRQRSSESGQRSPEPGQRSLESGHLPPESSQRSPELDQRPSESGQRSREPGQRPPKSVNYLKSPVNDPRSPVKDCRSPDMDKSWISLPRYHRKYAEGVWDFMQYAQANADGSGMFYCPCKMCKCRSDMH
ncbi:hypothetical protein ACLB2K_002502 [Fragaria x ananassa]